MTISCTLRPSGGSPCPISRFSSSIRSLVTPSNDTTRASAMRSLLPFGAEPTRSSAARRREPQADAPAPALGVLGTVAAAELQRLNEAVAARAGEPAAGERRRLLG